MNHELAKTLTTALVQFIDRERPEGSMCCSNSECANLENAFNAENFIYVESFVKRRLPMLTEFEEGLVTFYNKRNEIPSDKDGVYNKHELEEFLHESAKTLLALAKKELARRDKVITLDKLPPYDKGFQDGKVEAMADLERAFKRAPDKLPDWLIDELNKAFKRGQESSHEDYIRGYTNGYKDAEYNESESYHFPTMPTTPVFGCDGIHCTNPQMDCINCPKRTTGGSFSTSSASGTSTLKAE